jgi:hypothetical protein
VVVVGTARKLKTSRRWHIHAKRLASSAVTGRLFAKDDLKILLIHRKIVQRGLEDLVYHYPPHLNSNKPGQFLLSF